MAWENIERFLHQLITLLEFAQLVRQQRCVEHWLEDVRIELNRMQKVAASLLHIMLSKFEHA